MAKSKNFDWDDEKTYPPKEGEYLTIGPNFRSGTWGLATWKNGLWVHMDLDVTDSVSKYKTAT